MILKLSAWSQFLVFFFSVYSQQSENQPITKIWLSLHCLFTKLSQLATFDPLSLYFKREQLRYLSVLQILFAKRSLPFFFDNLPYPIHMYYRMLSKASLVDICIRKWSYFCLPDFYGLAETHRWWGWGLTMQCARKGMNICCYSSVTELWNCGSSKPGSKDP